MTSQDGAEPPFSWRTRVYWEDTDAGGVVYHASYLRFFERARTEWLRARGIDQLRLREDSGVLFVVRDMRIAFRRAARLDDLLDVGARVAAWRAASMAFAQHIVRADDGVLIAEADVRVACVDAARFVPTAIPEALLPGIPAP
ncbi:MAG TPA: tol-pal system-associated acyl-CoA thioesterase [Rhodanobacteraceae bacterium]|nr:tol-pal system-associated acyl-CoA thioesterase [Rhodanobacteraceae bacterium]